MSGMWRPSTDDTAGVSDVLGSILLVGITVTAFSGLGLLVFNIPGPTDTVHAQIKMEALPGPDGTWGTGDEVVLVQHLYGEPVPVTGTVILVAKNGVMSRYVGAQLAFTDDALNVGETWQVSLLLNFNDDVEMGFVTDTGARQDLITSARQTVGKTSCVTDVAPPTAFVTQQPSNIEAVTSGNVTITAVLVDACNGVDTATAPSLVYTVGQGSPVLMTHAGGTTFVGVIAAPAGGWANAAGDTVTYQLTGMRDGIGNVGDSATQTDLVDPFPPQTFAPTTATPGPGQFLDFQNAQNDTDNGAFASLVEGYSTAPNATMTLRGNAVAQASNWESENEAVKGTSELGNNYAKYKFSNEDTYTANLPSPGSPTTTVKQVKIHGSGYIKDTQVNDGWRLTGCLPTGCTQISAVFTAASAPAGNPTFTYDITDLRPGGGAWTWADIENLQVRVTPTVVTDGTNGNANDGQWHLDNLWATVLHGPGYEGSVKFTWAPSVPTPSDNFVQLRYAAIGEQYKVEVRDPTQPTETWNLRGGPLTATGTMQSWSTSLTDNEWNSGAVEIRIVSLQTSPTVQSTLKLDFIRVTSP